MNQDKFKQVMSMLGEQYNKSVTPLVLKAYWQALKHLSDEQLEQAAIDYISDPDVCQFWPQPGSLIAKIEGTSRDKQVVVQSEAEQAWGAVLFHCERNGCRKPIDANEKVKRALKTVGGLSSVGMCDAKQLEFKRRDFISAYANSELAEGSPTMIMDKSEAKASLENLQARLGK